MDFYSFKNHMQKLVVIDFPHHMKNYFGTLNSADDHLLRDAISANNYGRNKSILKKAAEVNN